tara:strand:- start:4205 stop:5191 length:987 start_codon:yes stop_codon:yes gene_type:complete
MNFEILDGNNLKIRAAVEGEGPLVVLVHGWPESWYSWRHQIEPLAKAGFKVAAIDVRGYGGSDKPHDISEYTLKNIGADIAGVIDSLGYKEAYLFGHDWGGPIVWTTGLLYPDTIKAVGALSVPYTPVGDKSLIQLFRELYAGKFFYQLYFQKEGVAEAEFEADVRTALETVYFGGDGRGMQFMLENAGNSMFQKGPDSTMLENTHRFETYPDWITQEDMNYFVNEFEQSGFRGPFNRYRAQDMDFEELQEFKNVPYPHPACFVTGTLDPVNFFARDESASEADILKAFTKNYEDLRKVEILDGIGHWTQQESPKVVTEHMIDFLKNI